MSSYTIGDRIKNIGSHDSSNDNYGKCGDVYEVDSEGVYVRYDDGEEGYSSHSYVHKYYQIISSAEAQKGVMKNIIKFAKNLVLSADEKLLRKYNLKNDCGEYTAEARELVINKLIADNEAYLIDLAKKLEAEDKED